MLPAGEGGWNRGRHRPFFLSAEYRLRRRPILFTREGCTMVDQAVKDQDIDEEELALEAPEKGSAEELLDADAGDVLDPMRHSAAHVMAEAVMDLFPGTRLGIGPAIKDGFYYDFDLPRALVPEDLAAIEARMRESIAADHPFVRKEWDPDEGRAFLEQQGQSYKIEILDDLRTAARVSGSEPPVVST